LREFIWIRRIRGREEQRKIERDWEREGEK
jgi:hypothetical protein